MKQQTERAPTCDRCYSALDARGQSNENVWIIHIICYICSFCCCIYSHTTNAKCNTNTSNNAKNNILIWLRIFGKRSAVSDQILRSRGGRSAFERNAGMKCVDRYAASLDFILFAVFGTLKSRKIWLDTFGMAAFLCHTTPDRPCQKRTLHSHVVILCWCSARAWSLKTNTKLRVERPEECAHKMMPMFVCVYVIMAVGHSIFIHLTGLRHAKMRWFCIFLFFTHLLIAFHISV